VRLSVERAAKNQVLFREVNERIAELAEERSEDSAGLFVCECSHVACAGVLDVSPGEYEAVRANGSHFLITPGHELEGIERVVEQNARFAVVEKLDQAALIAISNDPRHA